MKLEPPNLENAPSKSLALRHVVVLSVGGLVVFAVALLPNATWSPSWGNFFGAAFVALGGLLATLNAYGVGKNETQAMSWSCIVVGGFAIAGASLQMALAG